MMRMNHTAFEKITSPSVATSTWIHFGFKKGQDIFRSRDCPSQARSQQLENVVEGQENKPDFWKNDLHLCFLIGVLSITACPSSIHHNLFSSDHCKTENELQALLHLTVSNSFISTLVQAKKSLLLLVTIAFPRSWYFLQLSSQPRSRTGELKRSSGWKWKMY